jgi:predicted nicotinamide N-methyase
MTFIPEHLGGGILWNASVALLHYFNTKLPEDYFKGKRVLELGAGVGYVGLYLASRLGARVTCTEHPQAMAVLCANVASSAQQQGGQQQPEGCWVFPSGGVVECLPLAWGEEDWSSSPVSAASQGVFEAVVSCELYFDDNLHEPLVWTMERVLRQSPNAEVWSIFLQRDFSLMFFALLSDLGTVKVEVVSDVDDLALESLLMHKFTYVGPSVT